ncbi:hypothetical protein ACFLWX_04115 [Chloroflexota bacterium]
MKKTLKIELLRTNYRLQVQSSSNLSVRSEEAAYPGDTMMISGKVNGTERENGSILVGCDALCRNQRDELAIICGGKMRVKTYEDSN